MQSEAKSSGRTGCIQTVRYLRIPDRPDGADRPRAGDRGGSGGLEKELQAQKERSRNAAASIPTLEGADPYQAERVHRLRHAERRGEDRPLPPCVLQRTRFLPVGVRPYSVLRQFRRQIGDIAISKPPTNGSRSWLPRRRTA